MLSTIISNLYGWSLKLRGFQEYTLDPLLAKRYRLKEARHAQLQMKIDMFREKLVDAPNREREELLRRSIDGTIDHYMLVVDKAMYNSGM
jgi:hypothetical protein